MPLARGQPDGMASAVGIFADMRFDAKAIGLEQGTVLLGCQTGVIQRLAMIGTDGHAVRCPAREHQRRTARGMSLENPKHAALIIMG